MSGPDAPPAVRLRQLRARADQDYLHPQTTRQAGRHQIDLTELGVRVAVTRARYPNRDDGIDQYAVTLSRVALDRPPGDTTVADVLQAGFGELAREAVERRGGGPLVRLFRVPAQSSG